MATEEGKEAAEKRALRPYRRVVAIFFAAAIVALGTLTLRGIIRHLDRLPSVEAHERPAHVDVRALVACAEDLERLEVRVRGLSRAFGLLPGETQPLPSWDQLSKELEAERVSILARCRLMEASEDPAVQDLRLAAQELEALVRSYALLYDRHLDDGIGHAVEVRSALRRASAALSSR